MLKHQRYILPNYQLNYFKLPENLSHIEMHKLLGILIYFNPNKFIITYTFISDYVQLANDIILFDLLKITEIQKKKSLKKIYYYNYELVELDLKELVSDELFLIKYLKKMDNTISICIDNPHSISIEFDNLDIVNYLNSSLRYIEDKEYSSLISELDRLENYAELYMVR